MSLCHRKLLFNALDYCSLVWSDTTKTQLDVLSKLYNGTGRITLGVSWLVYTDNGSPRFAWVDHT